MVVECEKCGSKFNLDETLLDINGSKVRCSVCKHIFMVLPPEDEDDDFDPALEETVALDSPPEFEEEDDPEDDDAFDRAFEDALQDDIEELSKEKSPEPEDIPEPRERKKGKKGPKSFLVVLVIILALVCGGIYVYLFAPSLLPEEAQGPEAPDEEEIIDTGNRRLDLADLSGRFISSDNTGQLFLIEGKVINNYPTDRNYIILRGTIDDEDKNIVDKKIVYAGNTFTIEELKVMTREEIDKKMGVKEGRDNSNLNVKPDASVPFMIVFYDLPDNLSEFLVETISSVEAE